MLNYDSLLEQAKLQGLPLDRKRGIIREYLQTLILKHLYTSRWKDKFFFLGGTCLRLVYGLKRFSEDLDFNSFPSLTGKEFIAAAEFIRDELKRENILSEIKFEHRGNLSIVSFLFKNVLEFYNLRDEWGKLIVKFETNRPGFKLKREVQIINSFGEIFPVKVMSQGDIFAEKIDAFRNIRKGRHIFDLFFMISKKFPIDENVLKANGIKEKPQDILLKITNEIPDKEFKKMAKGLSPFLFDERDSNLVYQAKTLFPKFITSYFS